MKRNLFSNARWRVVVIGKGRLRTPDEVEEMCDQLEDDERLDWKEGSISYSPMRKNSRHSSAGENAMSSLPQRMRIWTLTD